jgi:glucose/arabinose dehydrogenase
MRNSVALPLLAVLAACSGGSGGSTGGGGSTPAANTAPKITSAAVVNVVENSTLAYQATATDAEGNPVSFSISGGPDAAQFTITAAGALSFVTPPDNEYPADTDKNNVYHVQLRANDGTASSVFDLQVVVTNDREGAFTQPVIWYLDRPTSISGVPGTPNLLVAYGNQSAVTFDPSDVQNTKQELSTLSAHLSIVAHPKWTTLNSFPFITVSYSESGGFYNYTIRVCTIPPQRPGLGGCSVALRFDAWYQYQPTGWAGYGPDGKFYIFIGDGSGNGVPTQVAQDPNSPFGKILRLVDSSMTGSAFSGPSFSPDPDNPYAKGGGNPYVWAMGIHGVAGASFTPDGKLIFGDRGRNNVEEVNIIGLDQNGANFGWPYFEGTTPGTGTPPAGLTLTAPVFQYAHGTGPDQGSAIVGGYVYRGPVTALQGQYFFSDEATGNIWSLPYADLRQGSLYTKRAAPRWWDLNNYPKLGTITSYAEDSARNLYLMNNEKDIFRVAPAP